MNCHNEKETNSQDHKHHKHGLIMLLACLLPLVLIVVLKYFYPDKFDWSYIFVLVCPLLHIIIMVGMFKKTKKDNNQ